jgi:hypothetical protein
VEDRDLALEDLEEFKSGFDSFDENTPLDADQQARYEEL